MDAAESSAVVPARLHRVFQRDLDVCGWQAGLQPISPYVEAQLPDGSWKRVSTTWDFPPDCRAPSPSISRASCPTETRRIRIVTNLQIYWDQVLVDNGPESPAQARITELPLATATLAFRGYPQQVDGTTPGDLTYRYENASTTGPFSQERGSYTRYGDVTALLQQMSTIIT